MKVVVITGASSGIGKECALQFKARGYKVYNLSRHDADIVCDVTNEQNVQQAIQEVYTREQRIDILIVNAGSGISGPIEFTPVEDAQRQFNINFFGALRTVQSVLPIMRKQGNGSIVFTSSMAAILPMPYQAFYSASKAALNALCLALQNEVRDFSIRVSAVMPGDVKTGFTAARNKSVAGEDIYTHLPKVIRAFEKDEQNGMTAAAIAKKIVRVAEKKHPSPLYTVGVLYYLFWFLVHVLPVRLVNWIEGKMY